MYFFHNLFFCICMLFSVCQAAGPFPDAYPDVYESIEVLPEKFHGWHTHKRQVEDLFSRKNIQTVIEVGVWLGNWTAVVAPKLPETGVYYAIDHWKGSQEHHNPGTLEYTLLPNLFQQFLSNMLHRDLADKVIPVRMQSLPAARKFRLLGIRADLIYIDAGHKYAEVFQDIASWYPLLTEGGILCGDDWNLGRVSHAVKDYAKKQNLKWHVDGEFWWYE